MLKPTQDKKLKKELVDWLQTNSIETDNDYCENCKAIVTEDNTHNFDTTAYAIMEIFEKRGYHIGLPESIEHALNSGDGVYRP